MGSAIFLVSWWVLEFVFCFCRQVIVCVAQVASELMMGIEVVERSVIYGSQYSRRDIMAP
jgi:hypothetical protein